MLNVCDWNFLQTAAQTVQTSAVPPLNGGEFSDLTELSHADLNGLVSEIEGEDEIFKQFGNFELDNIFADFEEKVIFVITKTHFKAVNKYRFIRLETAPLF